MRTRVGASMLGLVVFLVIASQLLTASSIQTPIDVVSAAWVTSDASYETGRSYMEIEAAPGDRNIRFRITIQNLSNTTVSGVVANLNLPYPFWNSTGGNNARAYYSGSISPGTSTYTDFFLNIDLAAKPGEYRLKMTLNYLETASGSGKTLYFLKSTEVTVPAVVSSTRYMVIYSALLSPTTTVPTGNITISGNLLNTGKVSAQNTNVTVTSPILVRPTSTIIGQVDPNVPRPFSSSVQVKRDVTPGTYSISVSVSHADSMGTNHITQINLNLVVQAQESRPPSVRTKQDSGILSLLIEILQNLMHVFLGLAEMPSALS